MEKEGVANVLFLFFFFHCGRRKVDKLRAVMRPE